MNCSLRGFGKEGVVCSLTDGKREFNGECPEFVLDQKVDKANERIYGQLRPKIWVGMMAVLGGLIWFLVGLIYGIIFFMSFAVMISGVVIIIRSWQGYNTTPKKYRPMDDLLDDEDLR